MQAHPRASLLPALAAGLVATALLAPQVSAHASPQAAKSHRFKITVHGTQTGSKVTGTVTGTEGRGSVRGTATAPTYRYRWKFRRGVLKATSTGQVKGTTVKGTFKITGGTRRYKGVKGKGTMTGDVTTGVFRFAGKIA